MPRSTLSKSDKRFIRKNRLLLPSGKLAKHIGVSKTMVQRFLINNNLKPSKEVIERFRIEAMTGKTTFTKEEDEIVLRDYLQIPIKTLAASIGRSYTGIMGRLKQMGLTVPADVIERNKLNSRLQPGNIPINKGKKQTEFLSPEGIERTKATRFKKGNLPYNTKSDFDISVRADKRGIQYQFIRISLGKWVALHRFVWELSFGAIEKKMNIIFRDGNTLNCNIENLEIMSNADLCRRNSYHNNYSKELAIIVQLRGALNRQIKKHLKRLSNEKQNQ